MQVSKADGDRLHMSPLQAISVIFDLIDTQGLDMQGAKKAKDDLMAGV